MYNYVYALGLLDWYISRFGGNKLNPCESRHDHLILILNCMFQEKHLLTLIPTHDHETIDSLYKNWKRTYFSSPVDQENKTFISLVWSLLLFKDNPSVDEIEMTPTITLTPIQSNHRKRIVPHVTGGFGPNLVMCYRVSFWHGQQYLFC